MRRAARVCPTIGCSNLVTGADRYCAECTRKLQRSTDARRPSAAKRGYGAAWQRIRAEHLIMEPMCCECGSMASEVDHIISLRDGGTNDHANLRSLCKPCHSRHTASQGGGFGNPRGEGA